MQRKQSPNAAVLPIITIESLLSLLHKASLPVENVQEALRSLLRHVPQKLFFPLRGCESFTPTPYKLIPEIVENVCTDYCRRQVVVHIAPVLTVVR